MKHIIFQLINNNVKRKITIIQRRLHLSTKKGGGVDGGEGGGQGGEPEGDKDEDREECVGDEGDNTGSEDKGDNTGSEDRGCQDK